MMSGITSADASYWSLIEKVLDEGSITSNRTGVNTRSVFGATLRFDLSNGSIPLLQERAVWFRGVAEELFWFLRGSTDSNELDKRGVRIWNANGSREFLDARGLTHRRTGDLGPVYGFQWRHFGAEYVDSNTDYSNQGIDQVGHVLNALKTRDGVDGPNARRLVISAWNPPQLDEMALPPCHLLMHFRAVVPRGPRRLKLSLATYQRSADLALGVPFNMASYALLLRLMCETINASEDSMYNYDPGSLVMNFGDAHIYEPHVETLYKVLNDFNETGLEEEAKSRLPSPTLEVLRPRTKMEDYEWSDLQLTCYAPKRKLAFEMVV